MAVFESVLDLVAAEWSQKHSSDVPNRRQHSRVAAQGEAILHWIGETGEFFQQTVEIRDTSKGGWAWYHLAILPLGRPCGLSSTEN